MKSAYELAMERLNAQDPSGTRPLNEEQKAAIAEREVFLQKQLDETRMQGDVHQEQQLLKQLASEKELINEEMEAEKDKIRNSK